MRTIQILGIGCPKCRQLQANAQAAADQLRVDATVELISDMDVITRFEVLMLPALVIDGDVKMVGKVSSVEQIKQFLATGPQSPLRAPTEGWSGEGCGEAAAEGPPAKRP